MRLRQLVGHTLCTAPCAPVVHITPPPTQAHPRRVAKVASQIQREISEMFIYDKVRACRGTRGARAPAVAAICNHSCQLFIVHLSRDTTLLPLPACRCPTRRHHNHPPLAPLAQVVQEAICPERRSGMDTALSAVASITDVYVSGDLQVCACVRVVTGGSRSGAVASCRCACTLGAVQANNGALACAAWHMPSVAQVVKVYVSVYSDDAGKERAVNNLKRIAP
jgi:ribosome-binding factor A